MIRKILFLFLIGPLSMVWGEWSEPINVDPSVLGQSPSVAVDAYGNATLVFMARATRKITSYILPVRTTHWILPTEVNPFEVKRKETLTFTFCDNERNSLTFWLDDDSEGKSILRGAKRMVGHFHWEGSPSTLMLGSNINFIQVAADQNGGIIALWEEILDGVGTIYVAHLRAMNLEWEKAIPLNVEHKQILPPLLPSLAINSSGDAFALWEKGAPRASRGIWLQGARYSASNHCWSPVESELVISKGKMLEDFQVAYDKEGSAVVILEINLQDQPHTTIATAMLKAGQKAWSNPSEGIISSPINHGHHPSIAINDEGCAIAIWEEANPGSGLSHMLGATLPPGKTWTTPLPISSPLSLIRRIDTAKVVMDKEGKAVAIWSAETLTQTDSIQVASLDSQNGGWSRVTELATSPGCNPQVAVNKGDEMVAVWESRPRPTPITVPRRKIISEPILPPVPIELPPTLVDTSISPPPPSIPKQPFLPGNDYPGQPAQPKSMWSQYIENKFLGGVVDRIHRLHWTASPSPHIVHYKIYRNGALIATLPGNERKYDMHRRPKGREYYSVTCINTEGLESAPAHCQIE